MNLKLLLGLLFIVWRSASAEEYTNHWSKTEDIANVDFCSHDGFNNGSCVCNVDYQGTSCSTRKCRNFGFNGYLNPAKIDRCICPPGFLGRNCEPVSCVPGKDQLYESLNSERTISLLASFNTKLKETWTNYGDIGKMICNRTDYGRVFSYNYENAKPYYAISNNFTECTSWLASYFLPDLCLDDNDKPTACVPLDINNLYSLVHYSPPNSIIFVVTNMGIVSGNDDLAEKIVATSIANRIQINVIVYNNTNFFASDSGLAYLSKIATDTLGTFVLPSSAQPNEQFDIVNTLLDNWDQGFQVTKVFTSTVKTLPVDVSRDLYVAAQTDYETDLTFLGSSPSVVQKTSFWKLYKLTAENYPSLLSISNQSSNTPILVYSSGGLSAYSAFTSDEPGNSMIVDAAYSVSVIDTSYSMVVRLETGTGAVDFTDGYKSFGTPKTITLGSSFMNRFACQFNFMIDATCNSVGASVVNVITPNKDSVSFPVYCASRSFATTIYNDFAPLAVSRSSSQYSQSIFEDFACGSEIPYEQYGGRTFVLIAENSNDTNTNISSADNVFRNKNSFFYPLSDFLGQSTYQNQPRYSNFLSVFTNGADSIKKSSDYGKFMTLVMDATSKPSSHLNDPVSVKDILTNAIQGASDYSDIFMIINYNLTVNASDSIAVKTVLAKQRCKLFVLFVQTYSTYDSDAYTFMNDMSISSGGVAIRLNSYEDLSAFFKLYFPLLVANDIVVKAYSNGTQTGVAFSNVQLLPQDYYLLLTNEVPMDGGPAPVTVTVAGATVSSLASIGELQLFTVTPTVTGIYNISIFGVAQSSNAILYANTNSSDFISLSFVDKDGVNRNDVEYGAGKFTPVIYASSAFDVGSSISITYSDPANPAKPIYNGNITPNTTCPGFTSYNWTTNLDWICSVSGGLYHFKIDKKSAAGNNITRTFPITCLGANSGNCLNGGSVQDGVCSCPLEWSGLNCETPNCLNGGTVTTANICSCIPAFSGDFCETSIASCLNSPSQPDYRSEIASLVIVADVNALTFGGINADFGVVGVPITVVLYGDESGPRIVQSTTNSQHLLDVLKKRDPFTLSSTTVSPSTAPAQSDMYKALNLALDNQLTNRAFYVVYTSNADFPVDSDFLIRLAVRRAEIRVLSVAGTESQNSQTLSLVGNGIPLAVKSAPDFQNYLTTYIGPLFQSLGYKANVPQRVFNVFKTDSLTGPTPIVIPQDPQFDNAQVDIFVHVYNGTMDKNYTTPVGSTRIYHKTYTAKVGITFELEQSTTNINGFYAVEVIGYLKTAYGFNYNNANGANEDVNAGVIVNKDNTLHIYTTPYNDISDTDPANFPYLSISKIVSDGSLSNSTTVAFTHKKNESCFFQYYTILDVCSETGTIGYQVQLTTRASETQNRQQQFVLTCFKTTYQNSETACHGHGSPKDICACDVNYKGIDCTEPVCDNGGVRDMSICRCPIDFYGLRCQMRFGPTPVRVSAFIIDLLGTDGYAFNQSIASISAYQKAFKYTHYLMLIGNLHDNNTSFDFQQYADDTTLSIQTDKFWNLRLPASGISDVALALTEITKSYESMKSKFAISLSLNIFYITQNGLSDSDKANITNALTGLEDFTRSSIAYSKFSTNIDPSVISGLQPFSKNATGVRDWYGGLIELISETQNNAGAVIPPKPATMKCVFPLQTNIRVAIDRSLTTSTTINTTLDDFLRKFQVGFNYIESDIDRCSSDLPSFYTERTALTAFSYYDGVVQPSKYCPSQYASMISYPVTGKNPTPTYSTKLVTYLGKQINSATCNCSRFNDEKTLKIVLWLPRAAGPYSEDYVTSLKLNTTNAYHFVVPFYDITDAEKENDLYYRILENQQDKSKEAGYYLLSNAATTNLQDVIDVLYNKICETAGVDPTAVPPSLLKDNIENRYFDYYH